MTHFVHKTWDCRLLIENPFNVIIFWGFFSYLQKKPTLFVLLKHSFIPFEFTYMYACLNFKTKYQLIRWRVVSSQLNHS